MSTTEPSPDAPAPLSVPLTVLQCGTCRDCRWWRVKSDDEEGREWGICENPETIRQVEASGKNAMRFVARHANMTAEEGQEFADLIAPRFHEKFGCRHWQGREV